jgi:hypothetical protein
MDFIAVLIFTVRYQPKEINDQNLLAAISTGLSSTNWSTSVLLRALSPLMIRSYLFSIRDTSKEGKEMPITNSYGERLLDIFLAHIRFVECLSVLTLLLDNVSKDPVTSQELATTICEKMIMENKLEMEINWFNLESEIHKTTAFFAALHVDIDDPEQTHFEEEAQRMLNQEILAVMPQPGDSCLSPTTEKMARFGGKSIESLLFRALLIIKFLNRCNSHAVGDKSLHKSISRLTKLLSKYLIVVTFACNQYLQILDNSMDRLTQMQAILTHLILETLELQTQLVTLISRLGDDNDDCLEQIHSQLEEMISVLDSLYIARHFIQFQCSIYTGILSLLRNHALLANRKGMNGSLRFARVLFKYLTDRLAEVHKDNTRTSSHIEQVENQSLFLLVCELAVCVRPEGGRLKKQLDTLNENLILVFEDETGNCNGLDLLVSDKQQTLSPQFWRLAL